jgi:hypothetical protein
MLLIFKTQFRSNIIDCFGQEALGLIQKIFCGASSRQTIPVCLRILFAGPVLTEDVEGFSLIS